MTDSTPRTRQNFLTCDNLETIIQRLSENDIADTQAAFALVEDLLPLKLRAKWCETKEDDEPKRTRGSAEDAAIMRSLQNRAVQCGITNYTKMQRQHLEELLSLADEANECPSPRALPLNPKQWTMEALLMYCKRNALKKYKSHAKNKSTITEFINSYDPSTASSSESSESSESSSSDDSSSDSDENPFGAFGGTSSSGSQEMAAPAAATEIDDFFSDLGI